MKKLENNLADMARSQLYALYSIPRPALSLGIAGLIPFWGLAISIIVFDPPIKNYAIQAEITYGAVILSFLGGIHWGLAAMNERHVNWLCLSWGITPSLIAWGALFLQPFFGLLLLITGFLAAAIIDFRVFTSNSNNTWFGGLRTVLSIGTITALLLTLSLGEIF
jgi:hypothetical protein